MTHRDKISKLLREVSEEFEGVDVISIHGVLYHGTRTENGEIFTGFDPSTYADYDATWLTKDERIAERFCDWHNDNGEIPVVYKVKLDSDNIADLMTEQVVEDLEDYFGANDPRELIGPLSKQFDGWITMGGYGREQYEDIAIFNPSVIDIVAFKTKTENGWTEYRSIDEASEEVDEQENQDEDIDLDKKRQDLYDLLISKLKHPNKNLKSIVASMDDADVTATMKEYS